MEAAADRWVDGRRDVAGEDHPLPGVRRRRVGHRYGRQQGAGVGVPRVVVELARRRFLGQLAAGSGLMVGGLGAMVQPAAAQQLAKNQKRILCFYMAGGLSQLESWDPKPGTDTGGPFRSIPTSVPGVHISELLPNVAKQMQHLMIVRGVNTKEDDHGKGGYMMTTGRRQTPAAD